MNTHLTLKDGKLYYYNDVYMGDVLADVDGFYKFWPKRGNGFWDQGDLLAVAEVLRELNWKWEKEIEAYFNVPPL